jgi:DNA processing protein
MSAPVDERRDRPFWVAFSQIAQMGPVRVCRLYEHFGSLEEAWQASPATLGTILDSRSLANIERARKQVQPEAVLERVESMGIDVVTLLNAQYPSLLSHIPAAPPVLYVKGTLEPEDSNAVAIVGTRKATAYGRRITGEIASDLAGAGVTVVSGLARGIDGCAHLGALQGGGRTIAVLASGADVIYPPEHRELSERIMQSGALVSDYPPGTKPDAPNFPARNRLISGMSLATVVVEAPRRSGALITVDFAADQGREVMVVPGDVVSRTSEGSNRLLRDGARAVMSASDILEDLGLAPAVAAEPVQETLPLTDEERRLVALVTSTPAHIDEIVVAANMSTSQGAALMTMLELKGIVQNAGSQHYVLARKGGRRTA